MLLKSLIMMTKVYFIITDDCKPYYMVAVPTESKVTTVGGSNSSFAQGFTCRRNWHNCYIFNSYGWRAFPPQDILCKKRAVLRVSMRKQVHVYVSA